MTKATDMKLLKKLTRGIPSSPYSWKNTSQKRRTEIIEGLVNNRQIVLEMDLPKLIEGELYDIEDANDSQTFEALRTIKEVLMEKYYQFKEK